MSQYFNKVEFGQSYTPTVNSVKFNTELSENLFDTFYENYKYLGGDPILLIIGRKWIPNLRSFGNP